MIATLCANCPMPLIQQNVCNRIVERRIRLRLQRRLRAAGCGCKLWTVGCGGLCRRFERGPHVPNEVIGQCRWHNVADKGMRHLQDCAWTVPQTIVLQPPLGSLGGFLPQLPICSHLHFAETVSPLTNIPHAIAPPTVLSRERVETDIVGKMPCTFKCALSRPTLSRVW